MSAAAPPPAPQPAAPSLRERFRASRDVLIREVAKFGVVGAVAFMVDFGVFNLLRDGVIGGESGLAEKPLTAKTISVLLSTIVAYIGSRWWTFRHRKAAPHQFVLFLIMNLGGLLIALACLAFSHYVLGLRSQLADNISGQGVGLVLGTLFRFWAYRTFVFTSPDEVAYLEDEPAVDDAPRADVVDLRTRTATPPPGIHELDDEAAAPQRREA
jgi:putative flippase GtrA